MENRLAQYATVLAGIIACGGLSAAPYIAPTPSELEAKQRSDPNSNIADHLSHVTEGLVGAPYVLSPLGEGKGPDSDPRFRTDAFDCTTFVETALALSATPGVDAAKKRLDDIRYRNNKPTFVARRHFPEAEWLPELIAKGYLTDITRKVAGKEVVVEQKVLNEELWAQRRKKILDELPLTRVPKGIFKIDVWPIQKAVAGYKRIPPGTVLSVVRADYRSIPVRVSHQGLIIEKKGKLFMRHAADRVYHRVVDEPLLNFLTRISKYQKWPVTGIHLAQVLDVRKATRKP